jgi:hypothetical protein
VLSPVVLSHFEDIGTVSPDGVELPDRRPEEIAPLSPFPAIDAAMARLDR